MIFPEDQIAGKSSSVSCGFLISDTGFATCPLISVISLLSVSETSSLQARSNSSSRYRSSAIFASNSSTDAGARIFKP